MMRAVIVFAALVLAACQAMPQAPTVLTSVKSVPTPILEPCVAASSIPTIPLAAPIPPDADVDQRAAWARIRHRQLLDYIAMQRALLIRCATQGVAAP